MRTMTIVRIFGRRSVVAIWHEAVDTKFPSFGRSHQWQFLPPAKTRFCILCPQMVREVQKAAFPPQLVVKRAQFHADLDCDVDDEVSEHHWEIIQDGIITNLTMIKMEMRGLHLTRSSMPRGAPRVRREATLRIKTSPFKSHHPPTDMSPHIWKFPFYVYALIVKNHHQLTCHVTAYIWNIDIIRDQRIFENIELQKLKFLTSPTKHRSDSWLTRWSYLIFVPGTTGSAGVKFLVWCQKMWISAFWCENL